MSLTVRKTTCKVTTTHRTYRCDNCGDKINEAVADEYKCPACERLYCLDCHVDYEWGFLCGLGVYCCDLCIKVGSRFKKTIKQRENAVHQIRRRWIAGCRRDFKKNKPGPKGKTADGVLVKRGMRVHIVVPSYQGREIIAGVIDAHHRAKDGWRGFYPLSKAYFARDAAEEAIAPKKRRKKSS